MLEARPSQPVGATVNSTPQLHAKPRPNRSPQRIARYSCTAVGAAVQIARAIQRNLPVSPDSFEASFMKAKPKLNSVATKARKTAKKAKKQASQAVSRAAKTVKRSAAATKKRIPKTGIVAALKREAAKVTAAAEAVVEVMQEEFAKAKRTAKRGAKKSARKKG